MEQCDSNGKTALMEVSFYGQTSLVEVLILQFGAHWDNADYTGKTVLMYAAEGGDVTTVRYLQLHYSKLLSAPSILQYETKKVSSI